MVSSREYARKLIKIVSEKGFRPANINKAKFRLMREFRLSRVPTNAEILAHATNAQREKLKKILTLKPIRDSSGVHVVSIVTRPHRCPHGKCTYCPGGVASAFGSVPQSYTGAEPAMRRAERNNYDPYMQVFNRLEQYCAINKDPSKVELIILGGTFPSLHRSYQVSFMAYAFKAFNDFSDMFYKGERLNSSKFNSFFSLPSNLDDAKREKRIKNKILKLKGAATLATQQKRNETSRIRVVALCLETRPDYAKKPHITQMLQLGTTRVELGVQTVYESVLKKIGRGHTLKDTIDSTQLMKDSFLKVGYHMMPGLPGSRKALDEHMFKVIFSDQRFRPDAMKIYPCMVLKGTRLYSDYKAKRFIPMTTLEAAKLIQKVKRDVPEYCRIMRVQRDIPTSQTAAGVDITNLRQHIHEMGDHKCRCIRCREVRARSFSHDELTLKRINYKASKGHEVFLSFENEKSDSLAGFARLRIPFRPFIPSIKSKTAGIRELHVYGDMVGVGKKGSASQHRGLGMQLVEEAEKIARDEFDMKHLAVISGVGAREYYRKKLGYTRRGHYMQKELS